MSCLFDSLSKFVNMPSHILRLHICDFLQTNPELLDSLTASDVANFESNMNLASYVNTMRQNQTMGGATEIRSFTKLFKTNVRVKSIPNQRIIEFLEDVSYPWVNIRWTGGHFDPC